MFQLILPFQLDLPFEAGPAPARAGGSKAQRLERGPRPKRVRRDRDRCSLSLDLSLFRAHAEPARTSLQLRMSSVIELDGPRGQGSARLEPGDL